MLEDAELVREEVKEGQVIVKEARRFDPWVFCPRCGQVYCLSCYCVKIIRKLRNVFTKHPEQYFKCTVCDYSALKYDPDAEEMSSGSDSN